MKKLFALLVCLLTLFALSEEGSWQAFLMPDGSIRVTNKSCEGTPVTSLVMGQGETKFIEVEGSQTFAFHTSGYYAARVDADGMLITENVGSAKIRVETGTGASVEIKVEVMKKPTSISFSAESYNLEPGKTKTLTYTLSKNSGGSVSFFCSDESVATVDAHGTVTAIAPGKCLISAETYNGHSARCEINVVLPAPAKVLLPETVTGYACESLVLTAELKGGFRETVTYFSSDETLCRVLDDGTVECLQPGSALVYARASGGNYACCTVNILPPAEQVIPEKAEIVLYPGGKARVNASTVGGSGSYTLKSNNDTIAFVTSDGLIQALAPGRCTISLIAPGGAAAECTLTVVLCPEVLELTLSKEAPAVGDRMTASLSRLSTALLPVEFTAEGGVFTVDEYGRVTCVSHGTGRIIARCGGLCFEAEAEVLPLARELHFPDTAFTLGLGDTVPAPLTYIDGGGTPEILISDPAILRYEDGLLFASGIGSCTLEARLPNGVSARAGVTVLPAASLITFDEESLILCAGDQYSVKAFFPEGSFSALTWSSPDSCVRVDPSGTVSALCPGKDVVRAATAAGVQAEIQVTVLPAPEEILLDAEKLEGQRLFTHYLSVKSGGSLDLNVRFAQNARVHFTCESMDPDIAEVSADGLLTGIKPGLARIRVIAYNGTAAEILAEVT